MNRLWVFCLVAVVACAAARHVDHAKAVHHAKVLMAKAHALEALTPNQGKEVALARAFFELAVGPRRRAPNPPELPAATQTAVIQAGVAWAEAAKTHGESGFGANAQGAVKCLQAAALDATLLRGVMDWLPNAAPGDKQQVLREVFTGFSSALEDEPGGAVSDDVDPLG